MAYPLNKQWGQFENTQYYRIQHEIQLQTHNLLKQRQSYKNKNPSYNMINQNANSSSLNHYQSDPRINKQQLVNNKNSEINKRKASQKLYELIDMTKNDNNNFINQQDISKIISQNRNALSQISTGTQNYYFNHNNMINDNHNNHNHINNNHNNNNNNHHINNNNNIYQYNAIMQAQRESSSLQYVSRQKLISKLQMSPQKKIQKSFIKQAINNSKIQLNDNLLQMIQQIQMKALNQIDKLKQQKIQLMRQLKKQIQSNNQLQKQLNSKSRSLNNFQSGSLQQQMLLRIKTQMDSIKLQNKNLHQIINQQRYIHQNKQSQNYQINQLKNKIYFYQNQLRKRDKLIQQISIQNKYQGNSAHIAQLIQQGEQIRQSTIHLIHLKQGSKNMKYSEDQLLRRIQQLQQLLYKEQEEKQSFLSDLLAFKQKYQQLQDQNINLKRLSQNTFTTNSKMPSFSPIYQKQSYDRKASLQDYERTLYKMQRNQY